MDTIILKDISKSYEDKVILDSFNITFSKDKINCIVGESGGGKTTLLNIISNLVEKDKGEIIGNFNKDISYIFQEDRLIPWLTVEGNLKLALSAYYKGKELDKRIDYVLNLISGLAWKKEYPEKLSGGMKQRVNIARGLGKDSKVLLMDEPFKSLDYKTKLLIMKDLKKILKNEDRIIIFVTHDLDECIFFEGRVFVLGGNPLKIKGTFEGDLAKEKETIIDLL
ncbi:ABC transporter ATP-binding protein [Clostridium chrysemydis]|uniref:ABC transporter ATP-binding protein n=1 Tax=Clostridium chrysemydis TaxID=2665504 RepID=UPI0018838640|nr:ABC transporter ATP-binding protein [Clostridium chrysemydis]